MFKIFKKYPNLITAVSERKDGTMKLVGESERDEKVIKNREKFFKKLDIDSKSTLRADLVHSNNVEIVTSQETKRTIEKTDGLITADKNLFVTITVADCLPIFIFDPKKEIIALIHGGWRNLAGNILKKTIKKMTKKFGSLPQNILAGIGPGISQCHFEVKDDLLEEFKPYLSDALLKEKEKKFLDLKKIATIQLINSGIKKENIEISPECTFCLQNKYFSFRREKPKTAETMIAVMGKK